MAKITVGVSFLGAAPHYAHFSGWSCSMLTEVGVYTLQQGGNWAVC